MPSKLYGSVIAKAFNKEIDLDAGAIKVMLLTSAYTPNQDTHDYLDDVVAHEVTGSTGYTAGGKTLTGVTAVYDPATNTFVFDANDVEWPASTITARYAVIYDGSAGSNATRPLIGYVDFAVDKGSDAAPFTITWDATGIFRGSIA